MCRRKKVGTQPRNSQEDSNTSHIASTHEKATALAILGKQLDHKWLSMFSKVNYFFCKSPNFLNQRY